MTAPRPHVPRMPRLWWLRRPNYIRYMLRELTCVWIGAYVIAVVTGLYRLRQGPDAWEAYWQAFGSVPGILFQIVALAFVLYHTVTWFALAPQTMPIWRGEHRVPSDWIKAAHYLIWVVVSVIIVLLAWG